MLRLSLPWPSRESIFFTIVVIDISGKLPTQWSRAGHQVSLGVRQMVNSEMSGKVVMVTGANSGMGKEISLGLARMGATLVMVCRDAGRGEAARAGVEQQTG